jgi:spore germination cell wall hydrolase CwlJ-like protein
MYVNWYKLAQVQKEAGLKDYIPAALLSALISVMSISAIRGYMDKTDIETAAQKFNVDKSEIENALKNPQVVNAINKYEETNSTQQQDNVEKKQISKTEIKNDKQSQEEKMQINIIARTLYAEGTSESEEGLNAIASVIYNRSNGTPSSMITVIKKPKQFSCWNKATEKDWTNMKQYSGSQWDKSMEIATSMVKGGFSPSGNWRHYYNPSMVDPDWAYTDETKTQQHKFINIGRHRFLYKH